MDNWEARHTGSPLGLGFPTLNETHHPENTGLGYEGLSAGLQNLLGLRSAVCAQVPVTHIWQSSFLVCLELSNVCLGFGK